MQLKINEKYKSKCRKEMLPCNKMRPKEGSPVREWRQDLKKRNAPGPFALNTKAINRLPIKWKKNNGDKMS